MWSLPLVLLFAFSSPIWGAFDERMARYKLWPLASAAYSDHPEKCVKDNFKNSSFLGHIEVQCDPVGGDTCSSYAVADHDDKAIILVFRGSEIFSFQLEEEVIDEFFKERIAFPGGGTVSKYFYQAFLDLWNAGIKDDFFTLKNANPNYELWITGHSLGAAMASLCAGYIAALSYYPTASIKMVSFGEPRVGDLAYATFIDTLPYVYRVVHFNDLVPHLPPLSWEWFGDLSNYTHHKNEIWYNDSMAVGMRYAECDQNEGSLCSDQAEAFLLDLTVLDHFYYFDLFALFAENGCPNYNPDGCQNENGCAKYQKRIENPRLQNMVNQKFKNQKMPIQKKKAIKH